MTINVIKSAEQDFRNKFVIYWVWYYTKMFAFKSLLKINLKKSLKKYLWLMTVREIEKIGYEMANRISEKK